MILSGEIIKADNGRLFNQNLGEIENKNFNKIFFIDSQKGWAVGWKGQIVSTENGGESWEEQSSNTKFDLDEVVFSTSENGWIIGSNFKDGGVELILLKTNDGGKKWIKVEQAQINFLLKSFF
jgi:photosystem II stability/assembly factor-like uncharacterized protein